ncbi:uncharacterized protein (TIGR02302 family) [Bradyrhizobium sp. LB7.2]
MWQAQRERTLASIKRIRAGLPNPRLALHDPWALRALVMVMLVATFFAAGDERAMRLGAAFDWNGVLAPTNVRVDAWVTPPLYTGKPPVILSAANKEAAALPASGPLAVPAGSTLIVRSSGGSLDVVISGGLKEVAPAEATPKGTNEKHFAITGDGTAHVRAPSGQPQWAFAATPDRAPTIALAKDPERQARGGLQLSYKIEDDYGVTGAAAQIGLRPAEAKDGSKDADTKEADTKVAARPLFQPPQFPLVLPNARTRNGVGQTVKDLSEDPYAGADVTLTLTAKDEAGNEAKSEPFNMRLPERLFTNSLARALIEQRRILALDANKNSDGLCRARRADDRARIVHAGCRLLSRPAQPGAPGGSRPHRRRAARGGGKHVGVCGHHRGRRCRRQRQRRAALRAGCAQAGAGTRR